MVNEMLRKKVDVGLCTRLVDGKGRGVFGLPGKHFRKGDIICEYVGHKLMGKDSDARHAELAKRG